jgi:plasmid maintenance system antidote protein VapI
MPFLDPPITHYATARKTGLDFHTISRFCRGTNNATLESCMKMAKAWGWTMDQLAQFYLQQRDAPTHWHSD